MLAKDIREMGEADINARIAELERERFNLRVQSGTRTLDDPLRLRVIRRDVARLKTVLKEKVIGIAEAREAVGERREAKAGKREAAHGGRTSRRVTGRRGRKAATATNRAKRSKRA
ncbi:MAG TPA: 50S ribosomal protein L29 [Gemmatimonadaceae bacterium]|jgi:large subunit ribosomal protein L29|nr:50S ribosomal protein L29 [Gemmatimonadaceae bacterium]